MHHTVVIRDERETTIIRIVYDCTSKLNKNDKTLNKFHESGVNFHSHFFGEIRKFHENQFPLFGDLEKDFLMIQFAEEYRIYLKSLGFLESSNYSMQTLHLCPPFLFDLTKSFLFGIRFGIPH